MSKVNINGAWKDLDKVFVNIGGVWKEAEKMFCNIGGVWKEVEGLKPAPFVQIFTSSQEWTVPPGVTKLTVTVVSGGQGGDTGYGSKTAYGGQGGWVKYNVADVVVTPGETIAVTIGAGGIGMGASQQTDGGVSSFGNKLSAGNISAYGGNGGRIDTDGTITHARVGETGIQANGIYYAGSGGGGGARAYPPGWNERTAHGAAGGNRGGGAGGLLNGTGSYHGTRGIQNTGGSGGGGFYNQDNLTYGNGGNGGSGVVIIEWKGEQ